MNGERRTRKMEDNITEAADTRYEVVCGKKFWYRYEDARCYSTMENGVRVLRWVKSPGKYITYYC